jgi:2-C-methyl-D-erythritol 2,4-cyclodiphosphate synthase
VLVNEVNPAMTEGAIRARTGIGHDIHRLAEGHELVLGGVDIPSDRGFDTHSDGDVLCHAIIDAMAGALADGDLGTHFPENDPETQNSRSLDFLVEFAAYVRSRGWQPVQLDSFVVLGTTRLRPHVDQMRKNVSNALGVPVDRISVKARSNDGLGPEGEGVAASAWAAVVLAPYDGPPPPAPPTSYRRSDAG